MHPLAAAARVVAADCVAGPSAILCGGAFGALTSPGDVDAFASATANHLTQPDDLRQKAARGCEVQTRFDPVNVGRLTCNARAILRRRSTLHLT